MMYLKLCFQQEFPPVTLHNASQITINFEFEYMQLIDLCLSFSREKGIQFQTKKTYFLVNVASNSIMLTSTLGHLSKTPKIPHPNHALIIPYLPVYKSTFTEQKISPKKSHSTYILVIHKKPTKEAQNYYSISITMDL